MEVNVPATAECDKQPKSKPSIVSGRKRIRFSDWCEWMSDQIQDEKEYDGIAGAELRRLLDPSLPVSDVIITNHLKVQAINVLEKRGLKCCVLPTVLDSSAPCTDSILTSLKNLGFGPSVLPDIVVVPFRVDGVWSSVVIFPITDRAVEIDQLRNNEKTMSARAQQWSSYVLDALCLGTCETSQSLFAMTSPVTSSVNDGVIFLHRLVRLLFPREAWNLDSKISIARYRYVIASHLVHRKIGFSFLS